MPINVRAKNPAMFENIRGYPNKYIHISHQVSHLSNAFIWAMQVKQQVIWSSKLPILGFLNPRNIGVIYGDFNWCIALHYSSIPWFTHEKSCHPPMTVGESVELRTFRTTCPELDRRRSLHTSSRGFRWDEFRSQRICKNLGNSRYGTTCVCMCVYIYII